MNTDMSDKRFNHCVDCQQVISRGATVCNPCLIKRLVAKRKIHADTEASRAVAQPER